jgi:FkbM family methyltransferase
MKNAEASETSGKPVVKAPPFPFAIVVQTVYGQMILNRYDIDQTTALIKTGVAVDHDSIVVLVRLMRLLGKDPVFIDIGANVGTYSLALARRIAGGGEIHAFEPQRVIFNMLAGTMALNGLTDVHCYNLAVGDQQGMIEVPQFDYNRPLNFGSIEFGADQREKLTQQREHDPKRVEFVAQTTLDLFEFDRTQMIKIDVEGMEMAVLEGAAKTIERCRPVLFVEYIKSDKDKLKERLSSMQYDVHDVGMNFLCIPEEDKGQLMEKAGIKMLKEE